MVSNPAAVISPGHIVLRLVVLGKLNGGFVLLPVRFNLTVIFLAFCFGHLFIDFVMIRADLMILLILCHCRCAKILYLPYGYSNICSIN